MNSKKITVREAVASDAELIAQFNIAMAVETENKQLDSATVVAGVNHVFAHPGEGFYLTALVNDEVAGCLLITREWSDWRNNLMWWIQSVYVKPEWRRRGLYSSLYYKVKEFAEAQDDVCGYRLYVEKENTRAQATYNSLGMTETHYHMYEELVENVKFKI